MKRSLIALLTVPALITGCGLTEIESTGLVESTSVNCPSGLHFSMEKAAGSAELVVHARPSESFFVDYCHRAFLLEIKSVWHGYLPDHVLAIIPVDPNLHVESWNDMDRGETAVFLLESDPDIPEAYRPVSRGAVIPVRGDTANICSFSGKTGHCETPFMEINTLHELLADIASFEVIYPEADYQESIDSESIEHECIEHDMHEKAHTDSEHIIEDELLDEDEPGNLEILEDNQEFQEDYSDSDDELNELNEDWL